jgi:hypothetical protein
MADNFPKFIPDSVPLGATMRPLYMGRVVNTYPLSESELERISSLNDQVTARFSAASFLLALAVGIFSNAIFNDKLTPIAFVATVGLAPLLLCFSLGFGIGGFIARGKKSSAWEKIKADSAPVESMAASRPLLTGGA